MNHAAPPREEVRRARVRVVGRVQGVGYRPWVYARARALGLTGCVFNDVHGVVVEAQGARRGSARVPQGGAGPGRR